MSKKVQKLFFIILFFVILFSFSYFGMRYFPIADDNNQIGIYHLRSDNIYKNVINHYKSYDVRPFAFFTDAYIFSWFWDNMYALMVLMVLLHVLNVYLLYKICEKIDIKLNLFCLITFALSPILIEALYWISAATRIVLSLFLVLSSIYLLILSFDEERTYLKLIEFIGSIIINLISVGFYEQTIALNLFLFCFVLICLKKYKYMFIPFISTIWIGIYYAYFMLLGKTQERGTLYLSSIFSNIKDCIFLIIKRFGAAIYYGLLSVPDGIRALLDNPFSLISILLLVFLFIVFIFKNNYSSEKTNKRKIVFAIIMTIAPFLPFIILKVNIAYRNLYLSFFGICVLMEVIFDSIFKDAKTIKLILISAIILFSVLINISMINNYKVANELDNKIAENLLNAIDEKVIENKETISINYDSEVLNKYKHSANRLLCAIEVDWAMQGKIQVARQKAGIGKIYINSNQEEADCVVYFDDNLNVDKILYRE